MSSRLAPSPSEAERMNNTENISLPKTIIEEIRNQALEEIPNEACGYLIGQNGSAQILHKMTNADSSPEHFSFSPDEQFAALKKARALDKELVAVYHSHPVTPPRMSNEDIRLANDPEAVYVIYAVATEGIKAFKVTQEKEVIDIDIKVISNLEKGE